MRALAFLLAISTSAAAQEAKKPPRKPAAKQTAHTKATPEQVRRFKQLQEKRQR